MANLDHMDNYQIWEHIRLLDKCPCYKCQKEKDKYYIILENRSLKSGGLDDLFNKTFDKKDS